MGKGADEPGAEGDRSSANKTSIISRSATDNHNSLIYRGKTSLILFFLGVAAVSYTYSLDGKLFELMSSVDQITKISPPAPPALVC